MTSPEILNTIWKELYGLTGESRKKRISELSTRYQKCPATIQRWAKAAGITMRRERSDKGKSKVSETLINQISTMQLCSRRLSNQILLPVKDAKEILEDSGKLDVEVSSAWLNAKLREQKVSARHLCAPSPHVRLLSDHPNQLWQFDVTNCLQYYLDEKGLGERDIELELEKNKIVKAAKKINRQLLRYAVVDHCTGAFYFRYFYATGERKEDGERFLFEAMSPKDELIERTFNGSSESRKGKYHFHGVPLKLYADRGSIARAKEMKNLFEALKCELMTHLPGNPRAKGAVEGLMKIINKFEARLIFHAPASLEELNRWALDWTIKTSAIELFRTYAPRSALWSKITKEQLRICPQEEIFWHLISTDPIRKKVTRDLLVHHNGMAFKVPDVNLADQYVYIRENAYERPAIDVFGNGFVWLLCPLRKDDYGRLTDGVRIGEYKTLKHTETQKAKTDMEKITEEWGISWKGTGDKRRAVAPPLGFKSKLQVFGHQADKVKVEFLNKKGIELEVKQPEMPEDAPIRSDAIEISRGITTRRISFPEFLKRLIQETGPISMELNQKFRAEYGDSIEISEAEEVIRQLGMQNAECGIRNRKSAIR